MPQLSQAEVEGIYLEIIKLVSDTKHLTLRQGTLPARFSDIPWLLYCIGSDRQCFYRNHTDDQVDLIPFPGAIPDAAAPNAMDGRKRVPLFDGSKAS